MMKKKTFVFSRLIKSGKNIQNKFKMKLLMLARVLRRRRSVQLPRNVFYDGAVKKLICATNDIWTIAVHHTHTHIQAHR